MGVGEIGGALGSCNLEISSPLTAMGLFRMTQGIKALPIFHMLAIWNGQEGCDDN